MIYEAADRGMSIFVTTHYMDEAEYCNRISMMVDGEMKACDTPANLKKQFGVGTMDEVFMRWREGLREGRIENGYWLLAISYWLQAIQRIIFTLNV